MPEQVKHETFHSLDLDRFLLNTPLATDYYVAAVSSFDKAIGDALRQALIDSENVGTSLDPRGYVARFVDSATLSAIDAENSRSVKNVDLLNVGVQDLLDFTEPFPRGIVTWTDNPETQVRKIKDAGLTEVPFLVTKEKNKGRLFDSWKNPSGKGFRIPLSQFVLPTDQKDKYALAEDGTIDVQTIEHGDDKAISFEGIPQGVRGYLYRDPNHKVLPSQQGEVPGNVIEVANLSQIVELEKKRRAS